MYDVTTKCILRDRQTPSVNTVLREASRVLEAAQKYSPALREIGITDIEICRLRKLMARVAAYHLTFLERGTSGAFELHELQFAKDVILRTVELKFGSTSEIFKEFCSPEGNDAYVYSHSPS